MRYAVLVLALLACGCSRYAGNDANIYNSLQGQKVVGNEVNVTVSNIWSEMDGLPLADAHCAKYGKVARTKSFGRYRANYDCVTP